MKQNSKIYAIITARGGSKGLPRKNILPLAGKPLIAYTIEAALQTGQIESCFVSTEDPEIREISIMYGAKIIDRPKSLATDYSLSQDVIRHTLECLQVKNDLPDYFVLL